MTRTSLLAAVIFVATAPLEAAAPPVRVISFRDEVYPLLARHCLRCHQGHAPSSGVRLDARGELLGESNGRPLARPGAGAASRLVQVVAGHVPDRLMPPEGRGRRLTAAQIGVLRDWIDQGMRWDDALLPAMSVPDHWAFRPIRRPTVPRVEGALTPIDAFLVRRWKDEGLSPAEEAPRRVLIRRLYLDLLGVPPTPEAMAAFEKDRRPDAYERLVDEVLGSPRHGERYARHWLDVARHADSEGYESNHPRPHAWRYRDWVIRSFNQDRAFREFVREQLAGDELGTDEALIATGFLAGARLSSNEEDKPRQRNDVLVDIVNTTAAAFLGLTMQCAQCHNHKFDPITARDYYRFQAFFTAGQPVNAALGDATLRQRWLAALPTGYEAAHRRRDAILQFARETTLARVRARLPDAWRRALDLVPDQRSDAEEDLARQADLRLQFTPGGFERDIPASLRKEYDALKKQISEWEKSVPEEPQAFAFVAPGRSTQSQRILPMKGFYPLPYEPEQLRRLPTYLLVGGNVHQRAGKVTPGWPALFGPTELGGRTPRQALADWLTDGKNPLVARVWVNRVWQWHFGSGLVPTPADFGLRGSPPTHPELLDWLAAEFLATGSTKHLHRLIVRSRVYRLAATPGSEQDADNRYLTRWKPRRLEAEAIRDVLLSVAGELEPSLGGPGDVDETQSRRRGVYLFVKRDYPSMIQGLFDGPTASAESCPCRGVSTVPLQALYLLNNGFVRQRATALARRVERDADPAGAAFRLALGRRPDAREREAIDRFFEQHGPNALPAFCQALLSLNELAYLE